MTLEQIEQEKINKRNFLQQIIKDREKVEVKNLELGREIIELQLERKKLQINLEMAKSNEKRLRLEIKNLEEQFWSLKNS